MNNSANHGSNHGDEAKSGESSGLRLLALMGIAMLLGILVLARLGTPRIEPAVGQVIDKLDLAPLLYCDKPLSEKDLVGKVTVMHFWGTWCPPCREEFPEFAKVVGEFTGNEEVQFLSISCSQGGAEDMEHLASTTKHFLEHLSVTLPTYGDPVGYTRMHVASLMPEGGLAFPCTILVDRQSVIAGVWLGFSPGGMKNVAKKVKSLL